MSLSLSIESLVYTLSEYIELDNVSSQLIL